MATEVVVVVDCDPQVEFLLRQSLPDAQLIVVDETSDLNALLQAPSDLVVADVSSPRFEQVLLYREDVTILGIGRAGARRWHQGEVSALILRPYDSTEFRRTVTRLLRRGAGDPRTSWTTWMQRAVALARLVTVCLGVSIAVAGGTSLPVLALSTAAVAFTIASLRESRPSDAEIGIDVAAAAALLAVTGGPDSGFTLYSFAVAASTGAVLSPGRAALAGAALGTPMLTVALWSGTYAVAELFALGTVYLWLASAISGLTRLRGGPEATSKVQRILAAHRAFALIQERLLQVPSLLAHRELATDLAARVHRITRGFGAVVLGEAAGHLRELGRSGLEDLCPIVLDANEPCWTERGPSTFLRPLAVVPGELQGVAPASGLWWSAPLKVGHTRTGSVLLALREEPAPRVQRRLEAVLHEGALMLDTAVQARRLLQLSLDAERAELAAHLQDGLAQVLTHVRFELELLARRATSIFPAERADLERLVRVVGNAGVEVRATITELEGGDRGADLAQALRTYCSQLTLGFGDHVTVRARAEAGVRGQASRAMFGAIRAIVRAALADPALSSIEIGLDDRLHGVELSVETRGGSPQDRISWPVIRRELDSVGARIEYLSLHGGSITRILLTTGRGQP